MTERRLHHLLVCNRAGDLVGVVSDRDLRATRGTTAQQLMSYPPLTCTSDTPVTAAITFLINENISCLPVVDHGRLCGILTTTDLVLTLQCTLQLWMRLAQVLQQNLTWSQELDKIVASLDGDLTAEQLAERIVAARRAIRQEIQDLVNVVDLRTDGLTGMSNRQELEEILGMLLAVKNRYERPFSLAIVAVDHYQRIRESCGDAVVKPLLKAVARVIDEHVRTSDFVARCRDDAFAVVLTETQLEDAEGFCRRLLHNRPRKLDARRQAANHRPRRRGQGGRERGRIARPRRSHRRAKEPGRSQTVDFTTRSRHSGRLYFSAQARAVRRSGQGSQGSRASKASTNASPDRFRPQRQVGHEALVRPAFSIVGHPRRHRQATLDQLQREVVEQRAVIEKMIAAAAGAVARKLPAADRQVAGASALDARRKAPSAAASVPSTQRWASIENPQLRAQPIAEHQGVHQAARPGDNGRPAAGTPQHGNAQARGKRRAAPRRRNCDDRPTTTIGCRGSQSRSVSAGASPASASSSSASSSARFSAAVGNVRSRYRMEAQSCCGDYRSNNDRGSSDCRIID